MARMGWTRAWHAKQQGDLGLPLACPGGAHEQEAGAAGAVGRTGEEASEDQQLLSQSWTKPLA